MLQNWVIKCNDRNNSGKIQNFIKLAKTTSPTGFSGATTLPPIGKKHMYTVTSSNNPGYNVFVSFDRTGVTQITIVTFYFNSYSIITIDSIKSMVRVRIQLLLEDNTWSTSYNKPKNDRYSDASTDWTLLFLKFSVEKYRIKLFCDEIDTTRADTCFNTITITHSEY